MATRSRSPRIQSNLAAAHLMMGDADSAEPLLRAALAFWSTEPLGKHDATYRTYNNLGAILLRRGDIEGAIEALGDAVRHARATEGAEGALVQLSSNLGKLHHDAGRYVLADSIFRAALPVAATALGEDNPLYYPIRGGVADGRLMTGHVDEADGMFAALEADLEERFPEQTTRRAYPVVGQGNAALMRGDLEDADRHYAQAVRLFEVEMPRQSTDVADVLIDQAEIRLRTGRTAEALGSRVRRPRSTTRKVPTDGSALGLRACSEPSSPRPDGSKKASA